ncbi:MAG: polyamine ABC transporter substrate-binding protein [Pseudomonadota bacterium]
MKALLGGAALAALLAVPALGAEGTVRIYNWSDYIDEDILAEFTAETGIEVVYDVFDSNEVLETKLLAGGTGYDLVVPTGDFLQRQIQAGVFQKLDASKIPNLTNMWDEIRARTEAFDPGHEYSVNYMWGTTGIGYNVEAVQERLGVDAIDSWDVIFKPEMISKFADCGVFILDAPTELIPAALNYLGHDPNSRDNDQIEEAASLLEGIRPHVTQFHSSQYINALANGDACLAVGWSGDVLQARDRAAEADNGITVEYAIPKEGALMWFDQMAIPSDAPNPEAAHAFLDYLQRPEVIAKASNYVYYANGNAASKEFLVEDVIGDPAIYPPEETIANTWTAVPYPPKTQRVVTRAWTRIKTGS